jgi:hypothetical protein
MKQLLDGLLPRIFPGLTAGRDFLCIPHEGKQDLAKSIPRKLRGWTEPGTRFVILQDQDLENCHDLKERLCALAREAGRPETMVRLACRELEAWYLGDPEALAEAFGRVSLKGLADKARFRNPDQVQNPSQEIAKLVPQFQKVAGARQMAGHLDPAHNRSRSFQVLFEGIHKLLETG